MVVKGDATLKSGAKSARRGRKRQPVQVTNGFEGQLVELCRDLAVEAKRMRQLQEQADELRALIRPWVAHPPARRA